MPSPLPVPLGRLLGDHGLRASDAEREWVVDRLRVHTGDGRLSPDELGERIDLAYASRTRGELARLLGDLPDRLPPVGKVAVRRPQRRPARPRGAGRRRWVPVALLAVAVVVGAAGGPGDGVARNVGREAAVRAALEFTGAELATEVDRRWDGWEIEVRRPDGALQEVEVDEEGRVVEVDSED
jgi:hypothetical protein